MKPEPAKIKISKIPTGSVNKVDIRIHCPRPKCANKEKGAGWAGSLSALGNTKGTWQCPMCNRKQTYDILLQLKQVRVFIGRQKEKIVVAG